MNVRTVLAIGFTTASLVAGAGFLAPPAQASAQACSGSGCDGKNPNTYCGSDARTVESLRIAYSGAPSGVGPLLELRYSPACRAAWARISDAGWSSGDAYQPSAKVIRNGDGRTYTCYVPVGATSCYTSMVNDANVTSYAWGSYDSGAWTAQGRTGSYFR